MQNPNANGSSTSTDSLTNEPVNDPNWFQLSSETAKVAGAFAQLFALELNQAVRSVPKMIGVVLMSLFFAVCAWLSLSAFAAWSVYSLTHSSLLGMAALFVMQLLALFVCGYQVSTYKKRISLPHTRAHWQQLKGGISEAFQTH